jgi:hypothetical protein
VARSAIRWESSVKWKTTYSVLVAAVLVVLAAPAGGATPVHLESPRAIAPSFAGAVASRIRVLASTPRHLAGASWWGGTYEVPGGEHVTIYISTSYEQADTVAQQWVGFFGGLPHGKELSLAKIYIAPLAEVEQMCSADNVLGCYGGQTLVILGDSIAGIAPASIATHEYGHHVAANRSNAPWRAIDWGTKRWATQSGICGRVDAGTVFPGDEGANYSLNPGEGFAESYRVLVETKGTGVGYDWPIVDPSFRPNSEALAAIREDVLHPWFAAPARTIRGKFLRRSHTWSATVATPLDGELHLRLTASGGGAHDVTLLSSDGRRVLATSSWNSSGGKSIEYRVCGARSVRARVTRGAASARFTLRVTTP